jgi:hypothetical protein
VNPPQVGSAPSVEQRLSALPDFALGIAFLVTWGAPTLLGFGMLRVAMLSMLLEFIVIHSGALMAGVLLADRGRAQRVMAILPMALLYSGFVVAFSWLMGEWWPLAAFWALMANRLTWVFLAPGEREVVQRRKTSEWASATLLYLGWVGVTALLPLPRLGVTPEAVASVQTLGEGLWIEQPQAVLAAGAGYFLTQAWMQWSGRFVWGASPITLKRRT